MSFQTQNLQQWVRFGNLRWTGLQFAIRNNQVDVVQFLLEQPGIIVNTPRYHRGSSPVQMAAQVGCPKMLKALLAFDNIDLGNDFNSSVAWSVIGCGEGGDEEDVEKRLECVRMLTADDRVHWNILNPSSQLPPLLHCVEKGYEKMGVIILQKSSADLDSQTVAGEAR